MSSHEVENLEVSSIGPDSSRALAGPALGGGSVRLPEINGLRGVAILMVLFSHLYAPVFFVTDPTPWQPERGYASIPFWMITVLRNSWTGVNIFFVLSGFVLFRPYVCGTRQLATKAHYVDFYIRRAWRLIPLLFISTAVLIALYYRWNSGAECFGRLAEIVTGLFVFDKKAFIPAINLPLWSLGIELWYSVAFPFVAILLLKPKPLIWSVIFYFCALLTRLIGSHMFLVNWTNPFLNPVKDCLLGRIDDFVAGMLVCLVYYRYPDKTWLGSRLIGIAGVAAFGAGCILWDLCQYCSFPRWGVAVANIPINIGAGCLLLYALKSASSFWAAFLRFETLQICGVMCYSIYVWHFNIQWHLAPNPMKMHQVIVYLGFLAMVASASWSLIESARLQEIKARLQSLFSMS